MIVSPEVATEYLELIERLLISPQRGSAFHQRLRRQDIITHVRLGARYTESRDPDDNLMLATAAVGKAQFLITNDRDLLEISAEHKRKFRFEILTPQQFLLRTEE